MTYPTFDPTFPARAVKALAEQADREALELAADLLSTSSYGFTLNGIVTAHSTIASLSTSTTNSISGVALNVISLSTNLVSVASGVVSAHSAVASLSTQTSTIADVANTALVTLNTEIINTNISLNTHISTTSTSLQNVRSQVASLSTVVSSGLSTTNSNTRSLSTDLSNTRSSVASLSTVVSTGLSVAQSGITSLSTNIQPLLTTYKQGVVGVATYTGSSQNIPTTATPITFNPTTGTTTVISANTDTEISALILRNIESAGTYGNAAVFRESPLVQKQGNSREVMITISHTLSGSATGALTYEVRSVASNALVNQGTVIMTAKANTVPITILFNTISDTASIASGYVLRFTTTTNVTVSLTRTHLIAIAK